MTAPDPKGRVTLERVHLLDHSAHQLGWEFPWWPAWLLNGVRVQVVAHDEASGKTRYATREVFCGPFAHLLSWTSAGRVTHGFEAVAKALKERAER